MKTSKLRTRHTPLNVYGDKKNDYNRSKMKQEVKDEIEYYKGVDYSLMAKRDIKNLVKDV